VLKKEKGEKQKMHIKKVLSIGFIALIVLSLTVVAIPITSAVPAQAIWVEPVDSGTKNLGDSFTVAIKINITDPDGAGGETGLFGFEYKFGWDDTSVSLTSYDVHGDNAPPGDLLPGWLSSLVAKDDTSVSGIHWYGVSALTGVAFTGVYSLAEYTFQVISQPTFPAADYVGVLDIYDDKLVADFDAGLITHTTGDGAYTVPAIVPPPPTLKLKPAPLVQGVYGVNFNITVEIEGLFADFDLAGWEAKISYDTSVLDGLQSFEGEFLPGFEGVNGTYYVNLINDTVGVIHTAGLFLGNHTTPSGSGVLAYLMFNATYQFEVPTEGAPPFDFPVDLYDTKLSDSATDPITHWVNDTVYRAPYYTLGWALDCYTDTWRTFCETDNLGLGPNATADAYSPQQFVKLYAYLSYNEYPEQNKDVYFEIWGPRNPFDNITIYRSAITNASGVATINFTIPWPCDHAYEMIMGKWTCYQYAWVKSPWKPDYYEKAMDILQFDVGWIIELLDVTVEPDPVTPCQNLNITITYKNIMQIPKDVLFTFTILDTLLDPIGETIVWEYQVPAGQYCNPYCDSLSALIHIPKWTHVGPGATVYVNAFTALPTDCGLIYCPEIFVQFEIAIP
jgi:hypothetical protein